MNSSCLLCGPTCFATREFNLTDSTNLTAIACTSKCTRHSSSDAGLAFPLWLRKRMETHPTTPNLPPTPNKNDYPQSMTSDENTSLPQTSDVPSRNEYQNSDVPLKIHRLEDVFSYWNGWSLFGGTFSLGFRVARALYQGIGFIDEKNSTQSFLTKIHHGEGWNQLSNEKRAPGSLLGITKYYPVLGGWFHQPLL